MSPMAAQIHAIVYIYTALDNTLLFVITVTLIFTVISLKAEIGFWIWELDIVVEAKKQFLLRPKPKFKIQTHLFNQSAILES